MSKPALRADQVGSLLRPERLKQARTAHQEGRLSREELRAVEDACIREAVRRQEDAGLPVVTDGDFRRAAFHVDFLTQLDGVTWQRRQFGNLFHGLEQDNSPFVFEVNGRIRHSRDIAVDDYRFVAAATSRMAKVTLPAPSFVHARGGRDAIDRAAYPDLDGFFDDLAAAFRSEIAALERAGCRYVQLDEVHYTFFCDPKLAQVFTGRGESPEVLARTYAKLLNDSFRGCGADTVTAIHLCRGNRRSSWVASGGYEPVAEVLFNEIDVDRFLLEFDDERSGGFEPLRFVPKGKTVVLGLVTSKFGELESADDLKRRIDAAARFVPLEQLALSPQCGFASSVPGNLLSEDQQWAKLAMIAKVAEDVWGRAG